jgi:hypothetical protein
MEALARRLRTSCRSQGRGLAWQGQRDQEPDRQSNADQLGEDGHPGKQQPCGHDHHDRGEQRSDRRRWPCFVQSPRMGRRLLRPNIDNDFAGGGDYGVRRVSRDLMTALLENDLPPTGRETR